MSFLSEHRSKIYWSVIGFVVAMSMLFALEKGLTGFVEAWGGKNFKALGGGFIGWFIARIILRIDLSEIDKEQRPLAGLSIAMLIAGFANAVT